MLSVSNSVEKNKVPLTKQIYRTSSTVLYSSAITSATVMSSDTFKPPPSIDVTLPKVSSICQLTTLSIVEHRQQTTVYWIFILPCTRIDRWQQNRVLYRRYAPSPYFSIIRANLWQQKHKYLVILNSEIYVTLDMSWESLSTKMENRVMTGLTRGFRRRGRLSI